MAFKFKQSFKNRELQLKLQLQLQNGNLKTCAIYRTMYHAAALDILILQIKYQLPLTLHNGSCYLVYFMYGTHILLLVILKSLCIVLRNNPSLHLQCLSLLMLKGK